MSMFNTNSLPWTFPVLSVGSVCRPLYLLEGVLKQRFSGHCDLNVLRKWELLDEKKNNISLAVTDAESHVISFTEMQYNLHSSGLKINIWYSGFNQCTNS